LSLLCCLPFLGCGRLVGRGSTFARGEARLQVVRNNVARAHRPIVTQAVAGSCRQRFSIVASSGEADAELVGSVTAFDVRPVKFDAEQRATEFEIAISAKVVLHRFAPTRSSGERPLQFRQLPARDRRPRLIDPDPASSRRRRSSRDDGHNLSNPSTVTGPAHGAEGADHLLRFAFSVSVGLGGLGISVELGARASSQAASRPGRCPALALPRQPVWSLASPPKLASCALPLARGHRPGRADAAPWSGRWSKRPACEHQLASPT
jgi:hypothetical protein